MRTLRPHDPSPVREALTLPLVFLGAALLAAVRVTADGTLRFAGPTLLSLVLAVMLGGLLLRAGALAPVRLVSSRRTPLANANGITVLLALCSGLRRCSRCSRRKRA